MRGSSGECLFTNVEWYRLNKVMFGCGFYLGVYDLVESFASAPTSLHN